MVPTKTPDKHTNPTKHRERGHTTQRKKNKTRGGGGGGGGGVGRGGGGGGEGGRGEGWVSSLVSTSLKKKILLSKRSFHLLENASQFIVLLGKKESEGDNDTETQNTTPLTGDTASEEEAVGFKWFSCVLGSFSNQYWTDSLSGSWVCIGPFGGGGAMLPRL